MASIYTVSCKNPDEKEELKETLKLLATLYKKPIATLILEAVSFYDDNRTKYLLNYKG